MVEDFNVVEVLSFIVRKRRFKFSSFIRKKKIQAFIPIVGINRTFQAGQFNVFRRKLVKLTV